MLAVLIQAELRAALDKLRAVVLVLLQILDIAGNLFLSGAQLTQTFIAERADLLTEHLPVVELLKTEFIGIDGCGAGDDSCADFLGLAVDHLHEHLALLLQVLDLGVSAALGLDEVLDA